MSPQSSPGAPATPKISLKSVHKTFGRKPVLAGLDLDIGRGESVVVIGGSGSGKSVMLKCILGLLRPDQGNIAVDGAEVVGIRGTERDRVLKKFGMLFQGAALFDSLSVWENVAFGLIQGEGMARNQAKQVALE
ncbi:MAG TPA: ATP-binding cassette domain-containing protein, partial [Alphaproteobacteria bacterium]|nr:ATP-binding cassette domain-containing protein [Alphaproteobacteria bacterium]